MRIGNRVLYKGEVRIVRSIEMTEKYGAEPKKRISEIIDKSNIDDIDLLIFVYDNISDIRAHFRMIKLLNK